MRHLLVVAVAASSLIAPSLRLPIASQQGRWPQTTNACQFDSTAVHHVRDLLEYIVSADVETDADNDSARTRMDLPATSEDSVVVVTASSICDGALTAYRLHRFGADTGWLNKVAVFRIHNRYAVYAGELHPFGMTLYVFDLGWNYRGRV